ncbi:MAG TPA: isoprenylcysteine carboxylmethyltransferase family protein [Bacteroidales bacterium]|nr:isoprenylcysteine carboxylmethyltransferase family protein [Bacteroidales bacterium]HPS61781.1 isoprenylcysteine carboxylmethyltransferase family protein [Bacteroidales bacterium]
MNAKYIIKHALGTAVFFAILFLAAGTIGYTQGLIYTAIGFVMMILNYTVLRIDPGLQEERSKAGEGAKKWDRNILGLSFLVTVSMYLTAGFDSGRFHWSPAFPWVLAAAGGLLTALGQLFFLIAQKQNRFFSSTVRIQSERGHTVCDTGLYRVVRHPAYLGMVIQALGFPLLMGSLWSMIPVAVSMLLVVIRTLLEDRTLLGELDGYRRYAEKTRYRLLPFIW